MTYDNREDQFLRQRLQKEIPILRALIQNLYQELDRKFHLNGAKIPITFGFDTDSLGSYTRRHLQQVPDPANTGNASDHFWTLEKRIRQDKKNLGVLIELRKSTAIWDIAYLVGDGVIKMDELEGFSEDLIDAVKVSNGSPVCLSLLRDGETIEVQVTPQKSQDGTCRLGAWVRDNMQGIGTLTFVEPDGTFAALGHGISDIDTGKMLQLNGGELYLTQILSVIPGKAGVPGELQGVIHYEEKNRIGSVAENTIYGIHGVLDREKSSALPLTVTEIAYRQEIETGPATVRMCVDNTVEEYEAEITEIDLGSENTNKNFVLEITDQRLLQKTGGIVQGNSGSPVLQNGRLIGAITHVFVNHPEKGYGVFAENMLARN